MDTQYSSVKRERFRVKYSKWRTSWVLFLGTPWTVCLYNIMLENQSMHIEQLIELVRIERRIEKPV